MLKEFVKWATHESPKCKHCINMAKSSHIFECFPMDENEKPVLNYQKIVEKNAPACHMFESRKGVK